MPRWHTYEPGLPAETNQRRELQGRIDEWWESFRLKAPDIVKLFSRQAEEWDLAEWMGAHLQAISPELMWEFGPGITDGHRLVITPEANRHLRPLVDQILAAAPPLPGWSFHAWRLPEDLTMAHHTVEARSGSKWLATGCRISPGNNFLIDLTFTYPAKQLKQNKDLVQRQTFIAAETLLGEEQLDRWLGTLDSLSAAPDDFPLAEAASGFTRIKEQNLATRPHQLCLERANDCAWTGWKLKPEKADEYARQNDLFVGRSCYPEAWTAAHSSEIFHSSRFSDRELFCYLKLDGKDGIESELFADKAEIEDAIDAELVPRRLGGAFGGGTGLRYSYIDLAVTDLRAAIPVIRDVLRKGHIPKRSWLLFFDDEWASEWVGIYPDTPEPPGLL